MLKYLFGVSRIPGTTSDLALLPVRLFLGVTFLYAGFQKLTDSQFFSPTAPGFIGRQMSGYVRQGSPLSPVLTGVAIPHPVQFGALIAFCEILVGLSALLGLLTRLGALGGAAISLTLFLTATWTVHPFFLGADLPYAIGWLTLALAGPGLYSLDEYFFGEAVRVRLERPEPAAATRRGRPVPGPLPIGRDPIARARFLRGFGTVAGVAAGGALAGGVAKLLTPDSTTAATSGTLAAAPAGSAGGSGAGSVLLGNVKSLAANSAGQYTDPASGDPALLIHLPDGQFVAYDAVCTHAGCTVEYDPGQQQIVCPCHGAAFDPKNSAAVLAGPTSQPLTALTVRIDPKGNAYAAGRPGGGPAPTRVPSDG